MRIYVRHDKKKDLWYVTATERYGKMFKTTSQHLPVTRSGIGDAAVTVMNDVTKKRNERILQIKGPAE